MIIESLIALTIILIVFLALIVFIPIKIEIFYSDGDLTLLTANFSLLNGVLKTRFVSNREKLEFIFVNKIFYTKNVEKMKKNSIRGFKELFKPKSSIKGFEELLPKIVQSIEMTNFSIHSHSSSGDPFKKGLLYGTYHGTQSFATSFLTSEIFTSILSPKKRRQQR